MVYFKTKNPNLGIFRRALKWKIFGIFYGHLVYFMTIWYNIWPLWLFGILFPFWYVCDQEKSGNPGREKRLSVGKYILATSGKAHYVGRAL
jgi:hypothetical protein